MEVIKGVSTVRILSTLYLEGELYTAELARKADLSLRHVDRVLPKMLTENLVESYERNNRKYYKLTEKGEALAFAFTNPDALADLYEEEETARSVGVRPPLLSDFSSDIRSVGDMEVKLLETIGRGNGVATDWSKGLRAIRKERNRLAKKFERTKDELRREIGGIDVPYIAGLTSIESLEDLELLDSFEEESKFSKAVTSLSNKMASIKQRKDVLELMIKGLQTLHENSLMEKRESAELKTRSERKLKIINEFLENVKKLIKS